MCVCRYIEYRVCLYESIYEELCICENIHEQWAYVSMRCVSVYEIVCLCGSTWGVVYMWNIYINVWLCTLWVHVYMGGCEYACLCESMFTCVSTCGKVCLCLNVYMSMSIRVCGRPVCLSFLPLPPLFVFLLTLTYHEFPSAALWLMEFQEAAAESCLWTRIWKGCILLLLPPGSSSILALDFDMCKLIIIPSK